MEKITIICSVAAEFRSGEEVFLVGPAELNLIIQAPAWIQKTLLFGWLLEEGTLKAVTPVNQKQLENDPIQAMKADNNSTEAKVEKSRAPRKSKTEPKAKTEQKAETEMQASEGTEAD